MIRRFTSLSASRILAAAVQAISLIVVARFVEVAVFGELSVIIAVVTFVFVAAAAGLPAFILREHALAEYGAVRSALRANIATSLVAAVILVAASLALIRDPLGWVAVVLAVAVAVDKTVDCQLSVPIAEKRMPAVTLSIAGRAAVMAVTFTVVMVATGAAEPVWAYAGARAASAVFGLAHTVAIRVRFPDTAWPWQRLARAVWPLAAANLISAMRALDALVVFVVGGSATAGLYSAATRPFAPAAIVAGAAGSVLMPHSARAEPGALRRPLRRLRWITVGATAALIPVAFLGPVLVVLLYGEEYREAGAALGIALITVPAMISAPLMSTVLQARGDEKFVVSNGVVFLPVLVVFVGAGTVLAAETGAAVGLALATWGRNAGLVWGVSRLNRREETAQQ